MKPAELQEILQSDKNLTIQEVKEIIWQLKNDCFEEVSKLKNEQKENKDNPINIKEWGVEQKVDYILQPYLAEKYYYGETNAFYICLDLLEKVGDKND